MLTVSITMMAQSVMILVKRMVMKADCHMQEIEALRAEVAGIRAGPGH